MIVDKPTISIGTSGAPVSYSVMIYIINQNLSTGIFFLYLVRNYLVGVCLLNGY